MEVALRVVTHLAVQTFKKAGEVDEVFFEVDPAFSRSFDVEVIVVMVGCGLRLRREAVKVWTWGVDGGGGGRGWVPSVRHILHSESCENLLKAVLACSIMLYQGWEVEGSEWVAEERILGSWEVGKWAKEATGGQAIDEAEIGRAEDGPEKALRHITR